MSFLFMIMTVLFTLTSCVDITNEGDDLGSPWTECEQLQAQLTIDIQNALDASGVIQDINDPDFDAQAYIAVSQDLRDQFIIDRAALGCN